MGGSKVLTPNERELKALSIAKLYQQGCDNADFRARSTFDQNDYV
ncbi:hypothetical protein Cha6605_6416 (plasmid) [Chamaesiphon minutus PCC 6605]|uniref:Uncharacterized protein n=1 Tax=Chamaesiphon minutus (strain ATCC 27169 / PCC 6605) TaxID=1173020 RepID=K9URD0_CHAP6|nr:hypothetical protein Cha6605_6416 [Chamaesiphon minutus PCC 6605]